jgi:hypothetical protein
MGGNYSISPKATEISVNKEVSFDGNDWNYIINCFSKDQVLRLMRIWLNVCQCIAIYHHNLP